MSDTIKLFVARGVSSVAAIAMFVVMLPVTIGLMLIMVVAGAATLATVRHRLRKAGVNVDWQSDNNANAEQTANHMDKPPIEGSYTVIQK